MEELFKKYVRYLELERSISPYTVRNYASDVQGFLDFLREHRVTSPDKINRSILRLYLGSLHEKGTSRASISRKVSALRSFYRYLRREKLVDADPSEKVTTLAIMEIAEGKVKIKKG